MKKTGKTFKEEQALRMFTQLMMALEAAHANGIIHRSILPNKNIFVTPEGDLKLGGF